MIQSLFGNLANNYEVIMPLAVRGFAHFYRANDVPGRPWRKTPPEPETGHFENVGNIDAVALIQSDYNRNANYPGNLEVVARIGNTLKHFYRSPNGWFENPVFYRGVAGIPGFIQGYYGATKRNFEVVTPLATGGMQHLYRANDAAQDWFKSPTGFFGANLGLVDSVALIQSNFDRGADYPGNLEVVARSRGALHHFYRNKAFRWIYTGSLPPIP